MTRLPFVAIWVLGWAALVFGIVALNVVIIVGGAVAVAGGARPGKSAAPVGLPGLA